MRKILKILSFVGFLLYGVLMLWLLFGQRLGYAFDGAYTERLAANINLIPFKTVSEYVADLSVSVSFGELRHAVINLVGNVIMFVPLGFSVCCAENARLFKAPRILRGCDYTYRAYSAFHSAWKP